MKKMNEICQHDSEMKSKYSLKSQIYVLWVLVLMLDTPDPDVSWIEAF